MSPIRLRPRPPRERGDRHKTMRRISTSSATIEDTKKPSTRQSKGPEQHKVAVSAMMPIRDTFFPQPTKAYISPYSSNSGTPTETDDNHHSTGNANSSEASRSRQGPITTMPAPQGLGPNYFQQHSHGTPYASPYTSTSEGSAHSDDCSVSTKEAGIYQPSSIQTTQPRSLPDKLTLDIPKASTASTSPYQWSQAAPSRVSRYPYGSPLDSVNFETPTTCQISAPLVVKESISRPSLRRQTSDTTGNDFMPEKRSKKVAWAENDQLKTFHSPEEVQEREAAESENKQPEDDAVSHLVLGSGFKGFIEHEFWKGAAHKAKFEARQLGNYFEIPAGRPPNPHPRIKNTTVTLKEWEEIWGATQNELFRRIQCLNCQCTHWDQDFKVEWTTFEKLHNEMVAWNTGTPENFQKLRNLLRLIEQNNLQKKSPCMQEEYFSPENWAKIKDEDARYYVWKEILKPEEGWPQRRMDEEGRVVYNIWEDVMAVGGKGEIWWRRHRGEPEPEPRTEPKNSEKPQAIPTTISEQPDVTMIDALEMVDKSARSKRKARQESSL